MAIVGVETRGEHEARRALAAAEAELARLRQRDERHDRWLDALGRRWPPSSSTSPDRTSIASALDILIRQTSAVDVGLAVLRQRPARAARHAPRRCSAPTALTVAAHPQVGRALRDVDGAWLDERGRAPLGVPDGADAVGVPVAVAGEVLGLLVMVFDEVEPLDADNRRLLAAISAAVGFALLRDRLVRELRPARGTSAPGASRARPRAISAPMPGVPSGEPPSRRTDPEQRRARWINILVTCLLAILAYWLLVPAAGLPAIVGIVAAILILIAGLGCGVGLRTDGPRGV